MLCWFCRAANILLSTVPPVPTAAPPPPPPGISEAPNVLYHCQNQDEFFVSSGVSEGADEGGVGCGVLTSGTEPSGGGGV
uniref:Putative secreted protein n=1 Tax=Anopheles darlingi TaxID=43151 RepID=A0A2M4DFZ1_ANODA